MAKILIVEDDLSFGTLIQTWLRKKGFEVEKATSVKGALLLLEKDGDRDLILSDFRLPDHDGLAVLKWAQDHNLRIPFIVMTSYAEVQNAVLAMKAGATDYIAKPFQPDILLEKIQEALRAHASTHPPTPLSDASAPAAQPTNGTTEGGDAVPRYIEGKSEASRRLYDFVSLVAPTPMSVLILGASGTGKEYVARRIHELSPRADKPFFALDCGAIPREVAASEFFGYVKGAFTGADQDKKGAFETANGGTLFLDEVGNLSYDVQVQLLRAIQERKIRPVGSNQEIEVDVRLVCATNENLQQAIARGEFREDLYHRLTEFTLHMPSLKDRGEDILLFANFFLDQANKELERHIVGFDAPASEALLNYAWPGNLRELKNRVKRATLLAQDRLIHKTDLGEFNIINRGEEELPAATPFALHDKNTEKERILQALQTAHHNKARAARLLGIDRKTLYNKIKLYDIPQ